MHDSDAKSDSMIYLDNAASTQIDPVVLDAMIPYLTEQYGNPGSLYKLGRDAKAAVEKARLQVARFLGAEPEQIIFTSGATEANNMVFNITRPYLEKIGKTHVITSQIEHKSVMKSVQRLSDNHGFDVTYLGLSRSLSPLPENLSQSVYPNSGLVSIMYANNEIGHAFDVHTIGKFCKKHNLLFHTDCVQAASCRPINVNRIGCDFATISSHKIHGPKGVGALFVKYPKMWEPMILGGDSQEFGLRGGTENVAGIVGFGMACELILKNQSFAEQERLERMKSVFLHGLDSELVAAGHKNLWALNGCSRISTKTLSIRVNGVDSGSLILMADNAGVCISAGSACNSRANNPSHVLTAIGLTPDQARSSFRVSFSRMNTEEEVECAAKIIAGCISTLLTMGDYDENR